MQNEAPFYYPRILRRLLTESIRVLEKPDGKNILVLSPHPDDDIFACGGTLIKHRNAGSTITSVYLTDGGKGGTASSPDKRLVLEREREAESAGKLVGIKRLIFLRHPDQELMVTDDTVLEMQTLLDEVKPDLVYLPFILDGFYHRDHMETNRLLAKATNGSKHRFSCCAYEVYSPLPPNTLVDITEQMDLKIAAMKIFQTQLAVRNYLEAMVSLNRYRALTFGGPTTKFMEAFFCTDYSPYCELLELTTSG